MVSSLVDYECCGPELVPAMAVGPQVTTISPVPLLSARPVVYFTARQHHPPPGLYQIILLGYKGACVCAQLADLIRYLMVDQLWALILCTAYSRE